MRSSSQGLQQALPISRARQPNVFARLNAAERAIVLKHSKQRRLVRNELLFSQGFRHGGVFLIQTGGIRTFYTSPGGRIITLAYWEAGNLVGTPEVLSDGIHLWSGVATCETNVLTLKSSELRSLMEGIPNLAIGFVEALEFKGKCLSALVQMLGTRSVPERLKLLLRNLAILHGIPSTEGVRIGAPFTHEAIAQMVGASRQWVTLMLDQLQRQGVLRLAKCSITIRRPDLLLNGNLYDDVNSRELSIS